MYRFIILVAAPVLAHDLYLMPKQFRVGAGAPVEIAFHNGDDFPESQAAPRLERLLEPRLLSEAGTKALTGLRVDGKVARGAAKAPAVGTAMVVANTKPNGIELEASKFLSYLKHEGLTSVMEWRAKNGASALPGRERYSKYVKSLVVAGGQSSDFYRHVVGFPVEIVPQADPETVSVGGQLPVQVLFRGKPASDLQIEMAWLPPGGKAVRKVAGRTDREGRFSVPIGAAGTWKLHTVVMERSQDAGFDWESFWTSLTFEIR